MAIRSAALIVAMTLAVAAQDTTDKQELRFKFTQGDKLTLGLKQKMNAKISESPDFLKDMLGEEPFDLTFEGTADLEVTKVDDDGVATLEGRFAKLSAKGNMMANEVDYKYDREKDGDKAPEPAEGEGEGMPGVPNMEQAFGTLATTPLKVKFDKFGKMTFEAEGDAARMGSQLFNLSALIGVLPKEKVGPGDTWKNEEQLSLPGLPLKMKVKAANKYDKMEKKDDADCAILKSEFTVGTTDGEEEQAEGAIPLKGKFTGKGTGTMVFNPTAGRPVSTEVKLDTKFDLSMPNPQGGDDFEIKGTFTMEQSSTLKAKK